MDIFNEVDKFFTSLTNYISYNIIFEIFAGLFLFTLVVVIISTSQSYEAKLIKAIDMFNNYFINNPQINEDNLISFNNKMKSKKVPKQLRKQWQQFVLYREHKASEYMSFENCVSTPIKNSTFKRDIHILNVISYILAAACLLLNLYKSYSENLETILQRSLLCPILILLLNFIVSIFLDLRHNAIVSDLNSNYQYFEVNIDKATQTLPEYVDYEVLFDRNEIKRGIPILYAYLQKRAEDEQKELERARLKNVEHEKFNFDEAGVASSLVLERAMQEAENYIAERKKYLSDIEQINSDITQEEMSFRDTTKEYQRQMQVSKETFEDFKAQLQEAGSSIQVNYLKKQQQQELERQRNLERDYDTATDRHKKLLDSFQTELTNVEGLIKKSREALEKAMMSEFDTYSEKVYSEAVKTADERELKKVNTLKEQVANLTEQLKGKQDELDKANQEILDTKAQYANMEQVQSQVRELVNDKNTQPIVENNLTEQQYTETPQTEQQYTDYYAYDQNAEQAVPQYEEYAEQPVYEQDTYQQEEVAQTEQPENFNDYAYNEPQYQEVPQEENAVYPEDSANATDIFNLVEEKQVKKAGRPRKEKPVEVSTEKKRAGRPKKKVEETVVTEKKQRGRPKKETGEVATDNKKGAGRPKKEVATKTEVTPAGKRGRPKKEEVAVSVEPKAGRGRPKKVQTEQVKAEPTGKRGRPKKVQDVELTSNNIEDIDEYIKQIDDQIARENAKMEASKRKLEKLSKKK